MTSLHRLQIILNHIQGSEQVLTRRTSANQYVYTLDNNLLTNTQRDFYEENGYLVISNLIGDKLIDECKERFRDLCNGIIDKGEINLMREKSLMKTNAKGEYLINKAQDIMWDDVFSKYIVHPKILKYVECFIGTNISALNLMLVNKPPDANKLTSIHPVHQDLHYFPFRPAERIVATWTAMEKITVDNGCLFVIPGTHKSSLQKHDYPEHDVNKAYHGIRGFELVPRMNLEMDKGDTVFFHPLLFHGSGPNITNGFRKAISCHYVSNNCHVIDVTGTTQENIATEIEQMSARKGLHMSFKDLLVYRLKWIQGARGSLLG